MDERHPYDDDYGEQTDFPAEDDAQDRLADYFIRTRRSPGFSGSSTGSEDQERSRPRHRLLIEQALESYSERPSLSNPQASVTRWRVPTGALIILALVLSAVALWPIVSGSGGSSEVLSSSSRPNRKGENTTPNASEASSTPSRPVASSAPSDPVMVHVTGEVVSPGLYELKPGSRINDALVAAGGPTPAANTSAVNLAQLVTDGSQIYVPAVGEQVTSPVTPVAGTGNSSPQSPGATGLVNLNTADASELQTLPQVGPVLAEAIIAWRKEHGGFKSVDELDQVSGIGPAKLEKIRPQVTV